MELIPSARCVGFVSLEPKSLFLADVDGVTRCCLRTKLVDDDGDDAAVILGDFSEGDSGVPWVEILDSSAATLDYGTEWGALIPSETEAISFSGAGDPAATGALIRDADGCHLQAATSNKRRLVYYDLETGFTHDKIRLGRAAVILEWSILLPRFAPGIQRWHVIRVKAGPLQD